MSPQRFIESGKGVFLLVASAISYSRLSTSYAKWHLTWLVKIL